MIEEQNKNELPEGWKKIKLGNIFRIERGGSPRPINEFITNDKEGINWIKIGDTKGVSKYITQTKERIKPSGVTKSRMVYEGDFILSNSMSFGRPFIMKTSGCIHDGWLVIRQNENVDKDFLYHSLSSNEVYNQFTKLAKGSTVKNLNIEAVKQVEMVLPPKEVQLQIVSKIEELFSELDKGIEELKTAQQQLKVYRQAVLKCAFEGNLTNKVAKNGELPNGWEWKTLAEVSEVTGGLTKNSKRETLGLKLPFLRVANVYFNELDLSEMHNIGIKESEIERVKLAKDDLLFVEGNGSIDQIGRVALWNGAIENCVHQNHLIKSRLSNHVAPKYALYFFLSTSGRERIKQQANSTSGLHTLSLSKISSLELPVCTIEEQQQIVQEIESRLSVCDKIEGTIIDSLKQAEALRQSILKKAFEGNLISSH